MSEPVFPPLFSGQDCSGQGDPFDVACAAAVQGCDAGLVVHDLAADRLSAAIVFAPEVPLSDAAAALIVCGVGFQNALGVLAPPEVGVNLAWDGTILVNGGRCGRVRMAAPGAPEAVPDWLVVGLEVQLWPMSEEMGLTPDDTALYAEGCADVGGVSLLETWVRHSLVWLNTWVDDGTKALHREWSGLVTGQGEEISVLGHAGIFTGTDEHFGLLLTQQGAEIRLLPLTDLLETPR